MGLTIHGHMRKRDVDSERHLKRLHKTVPFIESPLQGADQEHLVFHQRHEANSVELFFDLFFVANLATFTAYHSITDHSTLGAYVGFFTILWSTWYQVTLHDVRFARDSIYERVCKLVQFIVFVGFALVGSNFKPSFRKIGNNKNFRLLCYVLVISRTLSAVQYLIVLIYTMKARYRKLYFPLGLCVAIYAAAAVVFGAMTPAFRTEDTPAKYIHILWYVVIMIESIGIIAISCCWRMLSFKKTHLVERMGLLTLIVIGEGAIGVTKTVGRVMGKSGVNVEGCFLIMCIILVLVLLWCLYFDHSPSGHYGTIRQQIWSALHFPFHLAVVGIVEGSQQVVSARYSLSQFVKLEKYLTQYCLKDNLDSPSLQTALTKVSDYYQFDQKPETFDALYYVGTALETIGNTTDLCTPDNAIAIHDSGEWPTELGDWLLQTFNGIYEGLGMKLPLDTDKQPAELAIRSWKVVYMYYWSCFAVLMLCSFLFLLLIRKHKADIFDYVSLAMRAAAFLVGLALIGVGFSTDVLYTYLGSPAILPTLLGMLFIVLCFDKWSAVFANWRLKRSGAAYAIEGAKEHGTEHAHAESAVHTPLDAEQKVGVHVAMQPLLPGRGY